MKLSDIKSAMKTLPALIFIPMVAFVVVTLLGFALLSFLFNVLMRVD
jgi:hypothetical protein